MSRYGRAGPLREDHTRAIGATTDPETMIANVRREISLPGVSGKGQADSCQVGTVSRRP